MDKQNLVFATLITGDEDFRGVQLLIKSLRQFGGTLRNAPFWVFHTPNIKKFLNLENLANTRRFELEDQTPEAEYYFSTKVGAWARAEKMAKEQFCSLAWIDPSCIVLNEPKFFMLDKESVAACRPVHIRNVGQPAGMKIDGFWAAIFSQCNTPQLSDVIESYVDQQTILPYFNTHCFSVDPRIGVMAKTKENLDALAEDSRFIENYCSEEAHKIFLFQAVLSATLLATTPFKSIRILPPEYGYPFHLHKRISHQKRINNLSTLTIMVYEEERNLPLAFQQLTSSPEIEQWYLSQ